MSWQASTWVDSLPYRACPPLPFRLLMKLANVADIEGRGAWRSRTDLADELEVSVRSIDRAFDDLLTRGLITLGDQHHVAHIRAGYRPVVYDVSMPRKASITTPIDLESGATSRGDIEGGQSYQQGRQKPPSGATTYVAQNKRTTTTKTPRTSLVSSARELESLDAAAPWGRCPEGHPLLKPSVWAASDLPRCRQETDPHAIPSREWMVSA